jgi:hypothetical protein
VRSISSKWAHAKAGGLAHDAVNLAEVSDIFPEDAQCFGDEAAPGMVDDEAGGVPGTHGRMAHAPAQFKERVRCPRRGQQAVDHFYDLHQRHGIEEVETGDPFRPLAGRGDRSHRQRGGVGGEDAVGADDVLEMLKKLLLDIEVLDHGLDDDLCRRELVEVAHDFEPGRGGGERIGGNLAFFSQLDQCAYHRFAGVGGGSVQGVEQQDADACLCGNLGNAATHGAGAYDAEAKRWRLDVNGHAVLLGVVAGRSSWLGRNCGSGTYQSFHQGSFWFRPRT